MTTQTPGAPWPGGTEPCGEKAGFLFSHRCKSPSVERCGRCSRPVCDKHRMQGDEGALCVTCGKKLRSRGGHDAGYDDSPYFFAGHYYSGYGYYGQGSWAYAYYGSHHHDPHDFSEADGASLAQGDDSFEHDMGAS